MVSDLELKLRQDERILRFLTVKLNKYGIEYAEIRRKKLLKKMKNYDIRGTPSTSKTSSRQ